MRTLHRLAIASVLLVAACDDPAVAGDVCPDATASALRVTAPLDAPDQALAVEFREQGKPWEVYLPVAKTVESFAKMLQVCDITPALTVSLSGYAPEVTVTDKQVVGFGFSMMATEKLKNCLYDMMVKSGGIAI